MASAETANRIIQPGTLIATLGTEPQVVTIALDLLTAAGYGVSSVVVVHTDASTEPSLSSLGRLREEINLMQQRRAFAYDEAEIRDARGPLADIENEDGARATFRTLYREAFLAKRRGDALHICIAGGRKTMSVYGMTVAQLLFDDDDRLWHLVSFGDLLTEKRMHPRPGDRVKLVPIPVVSWGDVPPTATEIGRLPEPEEALAAVRRRREREMQAKATTFRRMLTEAEREVVDLAVREPGWTYRQIGLQLGRGHKTIDTQLQSAYRKMEEVFALEDGNRATLVKILSRLNWEDGGNQELS